MRDICEIAGDIARDPSLTGTARATSMPYLDGLKCVRTSSDMFGMDNAGHLVAYALGNLKSWRGESARALKAELKAHI